MPTDDGLALLGMNDADPALILQRITEARQLPDPDERAVRLYVLGRGLLDCEDPATLAAAIETLTDAVELGSPHAACDLGALLLRDASSPEEAQAGIRLLQVAAAGGHPDAEAMLRDLPPWPGRLSK